MGSRNLDRIPMDLWRKRAPNVWRMVELRWRVQAKCDGRCKGTKEVDLAYVASVRGIDFSPWNVTQACRTWRCKGTVRFWVQIPGIHEWRQLQAAEYVPRETLGERAARLKREDEN